MKIEIAEPGRMTQSGSSLLKLIQNNNMPILDLLVRESIQNSLDARKEDAPYVTVAFKIGEFDKKKLNNELEKVTEALNRKYWKEQYQYIAVRDYNTKGLTGALHYDDVTDNQYGNLLKLIYEISKPQEAEGAGGSWGLGKTVYFRVGMGLVLYYSRIIDESGKYASRLAASLVENELEKDSLIPIFNKKTKRGIAWWGDEIDTNKTRPCTDESYIEYVLSIFGIEPYKGDETGTTVIIPYIEEGKLLESNQIEYRNGEDSIIQPFWRNNIVSYLKIAVQRWYAPRLNNTNYTHGKYLQVLINNDGIGMDTMEPAFQIIQSLYNRAIWGNNRKDILDCQGAETKVEDINLRSVLQKTKAGTIAYTKVSRELLKTGFPDNKPEPYMYFNCEIRDKEKNKPIVCFTRKPGMIVSYEDSGKWVDGISSTNKDEFLFGVFVLNSDNQLVGTKECYSLEEYMRKSEMADHTSWGDFNIEKCNPRIVSRVQSKVNQKIEHEFSASEEDNSSKLNSGLGKMFGELLLPPENFGKKPSVGSRENNSGENYSERHKNIIFEYKPSKTKYFNGGMVASIKLKAKGKVDFTGIKIAIDSDSGVINPIDWENKLGLKVPFEIVNIDILLTKYDEENINVTDKINLETDKLTFKDIVYQLIKSDNGTGIGMHIIMQERHSIEIELAVTLKLHRRDIKAVFVMEKEGER